LSTPPAPPRRKIFLPAITHPEIRLAVFEKHIVKNRRNKILQVFREKQAVKIIILY
jgi:hypothetical protein